MIGPSPTTDRIGRHQRLGPVPHRISDHPPDRHIRSTDEQTKETRSRRRSADEAASSGSPRNIARWVTAGNEVALATHNAGHQRETACLKIFWVTEACEEVVDENGAASDIVNVEETAHVAPW